ncbi:MAG: transposase, partial [Nitrospirae bacterium]|nr:transposase [Nitrospirota bacterium]
IEPDEEEILRSLKESRDKKRKEKVELPFGHIKRNLNGWAFLLRGLKGVNAEMAVLSTCFNISRIMTIIGIKDILAEFRKRNKVIQHYKY